jgi:rod shape-determining protein MreC
MIARPRRYLGVLVLASAVVFGLDRSGLLTDVGEFLRSGVVAPVFSSARHGTLAARGAVSSVLSVRTVVRSYGEVARDRDHYRAEYLRLLAVEKENEFLRQALQLGERRHENLVLAQVVGFDPLGAEEVIIINKGGANGVVPGQGVVSQGRTFLGYVTAAEEHTARILLVTSEKSRVAAVLQGTGTNVTLSGSAAGALVLELIPKDAAVLEGELVLTSGLGGTLPPHLLVGEVRRVIDEEAASFKRAVVRPFADPRETSQVFVITDF